jgi:hypothetical protein
MTNQKTNKDDELSQKEFEEVVKSEDIFYELGLENIPDEQKQKLLTTMVDTIINRMTARIFDELSEQQQEEFDKIVQGGNQKEIFGHLRKNVPDFDSMIFNEIELLKTELREIRPTIDKEVKEIIEQHKKEKNK